MALAASLVYAVPLVIILVLFGKHWGVDDFRRTLTEAPALVIGPLVMVAAFAMTARRKATLDMDASGVRVGANGKRSAYRWADIAEVQILDTRNRRNALRIVLNGEIASNQTPNLIFPEFGYAAADLRELILSGVRRWGSGEDAGGVAPAFGHRGEAVSATWVSPKPVQVQVRESIGALNRRTGLAFSLLITILVGMDVFITVTLINNYIDIKILRERGLDITGTVDTLYIQHGSHGSHYPHLRYTYVDPNLPVGAASTLHGDESIDLSDYHSLHVGDPVPLIYDPQKPNRSRVNDGDWVRKRDPKAVSSILWLPNLIFLGMAALCGGLGLWGYAKTRRQIESEGSPILA